jgi:hypothetical protein
MLGGERKSLHCHNLGAKVPSSRDVATQVAKEKDLGRNPITRQDHGR